MWSTRSPLLLISSRASMEVEPTEASASLPPAATSQSWEARAVAEEEVVPPSSTSPTAREVEEELILPASTSLQSEEDTVFPHSTSLEGEDELPDISLPSSSEWPEPQGTSLSEPSSVPLESSPLTCSSLSLSPSPLSWKEPSNGLPPQLEETEGRGEHTGAQAMLGPGDQTKAKKKGPPAKKAMPSYAVRTIVPAEKEELVSVAKAMHREKFAKNTKELFHLEKEAALKSIQTGLYIGWRCPEYLWDCFRVGDKSKCFCGHLLKLHQVYVGCSCMAFASSFLCAACDRRWEEHETFFESEETRRRGGRPYGEAYLPFTELPELHGVVLTGHAEDPSASRALQGQACQALPTSSGSRALPLPPPGPRRFLQKDDKKA
ncbi:hypothetical protein Chor_008070 [Crotalus horridus]